MTEISRLLINNLRSESEKAYPNECCGVLLGAFKPEDSEVTAFLPVENARETEEQYHRFVITPEDFMRAERAAAKIGADIVGFYHSHPDHPAEPSDYDREHALPVYSYIIVSVPGGASGDVRCWLLSPDRWRFDAEEIFIKEE